VAFKAEAIVAPAELPAYLGVGPHAGRVSDLAYHNGLMVQIWSMLASRDAGLAAYSLQQLPPPPSTTSWITYARCHDDIGWAIDDDSAAAVGLNGYAHRKFLSDFYSGDFPDSWARGLVFQENPVTHDRRISGSLASLAGLECGDPHAAARIHLAHALVLGFGGIPVIWMGDELGLLNDAHWAEIPEHAGDNRWVHRPAMPWPPPEDTHGVQESLRRVIAARKQLPHLHASVPADVLDPHDPGVLLVARHHPVGSLLEAYNVTDSDRVLPYRALRDVGLDPERVVDRLTGEKPDGYYEAFHLPPYAVLWLTSET